MSYCRFSSGDVYMYPSTQGGIECCACRLADKVKTIFSPGVELNEKQKQFRDAYGEMCSCDDSCDKCTMYGSQTFNTYQEAIDHLHEHRKAGHSVPDHAFEFLQKDMEEERSLEPLLCECGKPAMVFDFETGTHSCLCCIKEESDEKDPCGGGGCTGCSC